jgi:ABC-type multidrug transport system fused ATPase/permease subunit
MGWRLRRLLSLWPHHRPAKHLRDADRLLVLHHGRLIEQGSHAELLAHGGQYARLYELQYRIQEQQVTVR